jgi:uncharacterized protein YbjT (DUF2867 family)
MLVAVAGGTGTLGREVVAELERRGHDVRALSRSSAAHPVDLGTGEGLALALAEVDVVVDAADGRLPRERLLSAVAEAGVRHHVDVSIVGADRVPLRYYAGKVEQERLVRASGVPWSIVRATQFHSLVASILGNTARFGLLPGAAVPLQPVDAREVAVLVADVAAAEPTGTATELAGPEVRTLRELAQTWRLQTGRRAVVVPFPVPGRAGRALRAGGLTNGATGTGRTTFAAWLEDASG